MTGGRLDLTIVVTWTVACDDGGTSTSRRPVSLPSIDLARTMHTTGRDGSERVTLIVTDTVSSSPSGYLPSVPCTLPVPSRKNPTNATATPAATMTTARPIRDQRRVRRDSRG